MSSALRVRLPAAALSMALLLAPAARALTTEQAGTLLQQYYIDAVPQSVLEQPTVEAMVEALGDPYTYYFTPEEYALFTGSMSDTQLTGVGISSLVREDGVLIQRVYEDTPAQEGGLQPGDLLVEVDGQSLPGLDASSVTALIQGEAGSQVTLTYLRDGASHTVTLTRRAITIPTTVTELVGDHIGLLDCDAFGGETVEHFIQGIQDYDDRADHWIVDLRNNGGGEVNAAIGAAGCFTGAGVLALLQDSSGAYRAYGPEENAQRTKEPVLVLTNGNTASASELFSAAIRDDRRGLVIGERTFGKGVAQLVLDQSSLPEYFPDGDAMKITSYRFYSAAGTTTNTVGVVPHLLVDEDLAPAVAELICEPAPENTQGYLRFDLAGQHWYVRLEDAQAQPQALTALLEALPATAALYTGAGETWNRVTAPALAQDLGLSDYRDRSFSDTSLSPYALQIDLLATYGIVAGAGDGTFQPEGTLTRAQLCTLVAQALNCDLTDGSTGYSDVAPDAWYAPAVRALSSMGVVSGVGGDRFAPEEPVTHEQFFTIMARVGARLGVSMDQAERDLSQTDLEDAELAGYADWAKEGVWLLAMSQENYLGSTMNLLWDDAADIQATAATTREEAAALTYSLFSYLGILPA